jgi:hypothetical protein
VRGIAILLKLRNELLQRAPHRPVPVPLDHDRAREGFERLIDRYFMRFSPAPFAKIDAFAPTRR